jgi:dephospho-CoA kinase
MVNTAVSHPLCIGLTGGIGSGKTTATNIFSELGVPIIDADAISHTVVEKGQPALKTIAETFGNDLIDEDGQLRRDRLRQIVFDDSQARMKLESIIHPLVYVEIKRQVSHVSFPYYILSSPLLLESKSKYKIDRVVVIDVPESMQIERASQRDNLEARDIQKVIDSQSNRNKRVSQADDVLMNDKDLSSLRNNIELLHKKYLKLAETKLISCL